MANRLTDWGRRVARSFTGLTPEEYIGLRTRQRMTPTVTPDTALRNSAVWACLRMRADLVSTFPLGVYRKVGDARASVPTPKVLTDPGGEKWDYQDWMYATQFDLDRAGNAFGFIAERDGNGFPSRIDLIALSDMSVIQRAGSGETFYRVKGVEYPPEKIWHERQYVMAGLPVGLSPAAYAASVISENISIQNFAAAWFDQGSVPAAQLRNNQIRLDPKQSAAIAERFKAAVSVGDPFVTGVDWEYKPLQIQAMGMEWLEDRRFSLTDIARFFGVPADLIDAQVSGQSVTYATITERNLQFLIMNLGPAVSRREKNLSKLTQAPRYVKLNTDALLRMAPKVRADTLKIMLDSRIITNAEARALDEKVPLTPAEIAEFNTIYGEPYSRPKTTIVP